MKIQLFPIEELKAYENNPRRISAEAIKAVSNSIREFGFKVPVIIDKDKVIVAGHTRILAAQELGLKEIPCIVADDLTPEQIRAFRLADNKTSELTGWDFEKLVSEFEAIESDLLIGFTSGEIEKIFAGISLDEDLNINADNFERKTPIELKLKFCKKTVPMTQEEADHMLSLYDLYVKENTVNIGFVSWLLKNGIYKNIRDKAS